MAAEKEIWQKIGEGFVQEYYNQFDNTNRMGLANLYAPNACLTWEGSPFQGREAIANKLVNLPFKRIKHIITEQDSQPTIDSCILIMVFGQLQADEDPPMAFHQVFMLKSQNGGWSCTNDVFRWVCTTYQCSDLEWISRPHIATFFKLTLLIFNRELYVKFNQ